MSTDFLPVATDIQSRVAAARAALQILFALAPESTEVVLTGMIWSADTSTWFPVSNAMFDMEHISAAADWCIAADGRGEVVYVQPTALAAHLRSTRGTAYLSAITTPVRDVVAPLPALPLTPWTTMDVDGLKAWAFRFASPVQVLSMPTRRRCYAVVGALCAVLGVAAPSLGEFNRALALGQPVPGTRFRDTPADPDRWVRIRVDEEAPSYTLAQMEAALGLPVGA